MLKVAPSCHDVSQLECHTACQLQHINSQASLFFKKQGHCPSEILLILSCSSFSIFVNTYFGRTIVCDQAQYSSDQPQAVAGRADS